jgi:hypothetical protein
MRKIEPPNPTAAALVDIAEGSEAVPLPREAKIPMPEPEKPAEISWGAAGGTGLPTSAYAKANGNQPREAREALARGLLQFDVLKAERDMLEKDLFAARERIHLLEIHLKEIEGTRAMIESRINTCILERDEAVSVAGELRGVIVAISDICKRYRDEHPTEPGE